jgi:hypothetical protein
MKNPLRAALSAAPLAKITRGVHVQKTVNPMTLHAMLKRKGPDSTPSRVS